MGECSETVVSGLVLHVPVKSLYSYTPLFLLLRDGVGRVQDQRTVVLMTHKNNTTVRTNVCLARVTPLFAAFRQNLTQD